MNADPSKYPAGALPLLMGRAALLEQVAALPEDQQRKIQRRAYAMAIDVCGQLRQNDPLSYFAAQLASFDMLIECQCYRARMDERNAG